MNDLHYVNFPTLHQKPLSVAARLHIPSAAPAQRPAVIILHGSAGPSGREGGYARALSEAGFVTLEPDEWSPRGLAGGAEGRPRTVAETLPDVYGARKYLASHSAVDPKRIGVMGFSFGGVATMLAATHAHNDRFLPGNSFAAYMPCYPVCWMYGKVKGLEFANLVDAPVFILTAALDQYDNDPEAGTKLVAKLNDKDRAKVTTRAMRDCHHGFDMPGVDFAAKDPSSNRGQGGTAIMRYNPLATTEAHKLAVGFFSTALKPKRTS
jgi:dienelactone hydrolase